MSVHTTVMTDRHMIILAGVEVGSGEHAVDMVILRQGSSLLVELIRLTPAQARVVVEDLNAVLQALEHPGE